MHLPLVKGVFGASGINTVTDSPTNDAKLLTSERLQLWLLIIKFSLLPAAIPQMRSYLK